MSPETLNGNQIRFESKHSVSNSKSIGMKNLTNTNTYHGAPSQHNNRDSAPLPQGMLDTNCTNNSLSAVKNSQMHHPQAGDENHQPLNSTFEEETHKTDSDKCIIDSAEQVPGTNLSSFPPSYESVTEDIHGC